MNVIKNGIIFGYARVSTHQQFVENQINELKRKGVFDTNIYTDVYSGAKSYDNRENFKVLLGKLRDGDTLIVYAIDRLSRKLKDIVELVEILEARGVKLVITNKVQDIF